MRRWIHAVVIATATLAGPAVAATTAQAAPVPAAVSSADLGPADLARALSQAGDSGWVPVIEPPFDRAVESICKSSTRRTIA